MGSGQESYKGFARTPGSRGLLPANPAPRPPVRYGEPGCLLLGRVVVVKTAHVPAGPPQNENPPQKGTSPHAPFEARRLLASRARETAPAAPAASPEGARPPPGRSSRAARWTEGPQMWLTRTAPQNIAARTGKGALSSEYVGPPNRVPRALRPKAAQRCGLGRTQQLLLGHALGALPLSVAAKRGR